MKAVLLRQPGGGRPGAEVCEVPVPAIGEGELLVEMRACGLCGTDIEKARGEYTSALPILGHEAVGVVSAVGDGAQGVREGDRVFAHHHVPCHECYYCQRGDETTCKEYRGSNIHPGGFAEFYRVPKWNVENGGVLKIPPGLDFETATLLEPMGCCIRALDKCDVEAGDAVLVVGAGPVGILHSLLLRQARAEVLISDVSARRLEFARKTGAATIDAGKGDVAGTVKAATEGRGADVAIVAAGNAKAIRQALLAVRKGGKVCLFGIPPKGSVLDYDLADVYSSEVSLVPSYGATRGETDKALEILGRHAAAFRAVITRKFAVEDFAAAVEAALSGEEMKVVIVS